jgi:hypothetical protein
MEKANYRTSIGPDRTITGLKDNFVRNKRKQPFLSHRTPQPLCRVDYRISVSTDFKAECLA